MVCALHAIQERGAERAFAAGCLQASSIRLTSCQLLQAAAAAEPPSRAHQIATTTDTRSCVCSVSRLTEAGALPVELAFWSHAKMKDLLLWFLREAYASPRKGIWFALVVLTWAYRTLYVPSAIWWIDTVLAWFEQGCKVWTREVYSFSYRYINGVSFYIARLLTTTAVRPHKAWKDESESSVWRGHQTTLNAVVERKACTLNPGVILARFTKRRRCSFAMRTMCDRWHPAPTALRSPLRADLEVASCRRLCSRGHSFVVLVNMSPGRGVSEARWTRLRQTVPWLCADYLSNGEETSEHSRKRAQTSGRASGEQSSNTQRRWSHWLTRRSKQVDAGPAAQHQTAVVDARASQDGSATASAPAWWPPQRWALFRRQPDPAPAANGQRHGKRTKPRTSNRGSDGERPSMFAAERYSLFEVNAQAGLFEGALMTIEVMWTRVFKALRAVLCVVYLVPRERPSTLEGGWGHARRQSFGDLVRHAAITLLAVTFAPRMFCRCSRV